MSRSPGFQKNDAGKLRFDLIDPRFLEGLATILTLGANKYADENWKLCDRPYKRYYAALQRHLNAYAQGATHDAESGLSHLYHAAACLQFLAWFETQRQERLDAMAEAVAVRIEAL